MTTSPAQLLKSAASLEDCRLPPVVLGYFDGAVQSEAHEVVLDAFLRMAEEEGLTRSFLARRIHKPREQITRWLSAPGNWTLETLANLSLAMGYRPRIRLERLSDISSPNEHHEAAALRPTSPSFDLSKRPDASNSGSVRIVEITVGDG